MTIKEEIHVGDIGTSFEITLYDDSAVVDVSGATSKEILFKKPTVDGVEGDTVTKTADFTTDGTDGSVKYVTVDANDLDVAGTWKIQAKVTLPGGTWSSNIDSFKVYANLA